MATFTTSWYTYGSGGTYRLILEIDDPPSISSGTSSVSLGARLKVQTTSSLSDSNNTNSMSGTLGSASQSTAVSHTIAGGTTTVETVSASVSTVFGSAVTVSVSGSISGYEALTSRSISGSVTIPARPYYVPTAPSAVTAARVSDTSQTVSWTRTASSSAPVTSQSVQRRVYSGAWGDWATVGTIGTDYTSSGSNSYTDTTTVANRAYQYRVVATNSSGSATSSATSNVYTTPPAPGSVTATKTASGDIRLDWTNTPVYASYTTAIEHSTDGGSSYSALTSVADGVVTYTHASPSTAVTHKYRLAHVTTLMTPTLTSAKATTAEVQLAAPPSAPTGLGPTSPRPADEAVSLVWTHNPTDSSEQSAYEVQYRVAGGSWASTGEVASGSSVYTITPAADWSASDGATWEWQVRTWGQHADPSAWSATATVPLSARPTVSVSTPEDASTLATSAVVVSWGYFDAESTAQASWTVDLIDSLGTVVETRAGSGSATSTTLATTVPDGSSWTVRVKVRDGDGLWSAAAESAFSVSYALPPTPSVSATWDPETATVAVAISNPEPVDPEIEAVSVDLFRSTDGETWSLLLTGVPLNTTLTDWSPPPTGEVAYRAEAVSALPSRAASADEALVTGGTNAVFVSGGPGFSQVCLAAAEPNVSDQDGPNRILHYFAGRPRPVEVTGEAMTRLLSLEADLFDEADAEAWRLLGNLPGPHLWRDPSGRYLTVSLGRPAIRRAPGGLLHLSLSATEVDDG